MVDPVARATMEDPHFFFQRLRISCLSFSKLLALSAQAREAGRGGWRLVYSVPEVQRVGGWLWGVTQPVLVSIPQALWGLSRVGRASRSN